MNQLTYLISDLELALLPLESSSFVWKLHDFILISSFTIFCGAYLVALFLTIVCCDQTTKFGLVVRDLSSMLKVLDSFLNSIIN
jgi:hypothetical protein